MHDHERRARRGIKSHLCAKIRKLWRLGFTIQKAVVFRSRTESAAFAEETRLILYYGRGALTNQTDGGDGPSNPSLATRAKIRAGRLGYVANEATRNRQRLAALGRKHSAATKRKISTAHKQIKKPWAINSRPNLGNGFLGRKWSARHRANFIKARTGHPVSAETRQKISNTKRGIKNGNDSSKVRHVLT